MRLFRRRPNRVRIPPVQGAVETPERRAERFWAGWFAALPEIAAALGDAEPQRVEGLLCDLVAAVHPDLHFALDRGGRAIYALVVSGQEDPALRAYTDAWKAAAPPDDAVWEFHDSVPPVPDPTGVTVNLGPHRLALADVRVHAQVDTEAGVVDVAVHHPLLADLDPATRSAMTFLPLDATLGERLAGRRLRRVETAQHLPADTIDLLELRELVHRLPE
ncbi:hypothetical protein V5P93_001685 [Actinokineospora auranticolor]|uniref:DUF695 domain-containing protein n=1 Tax=Actinokineospora auranticolor TaxID=155976 RepID=A0A2S6GGC2_9PSEU|nr:hypothetical protein [Actinokineospora auranticolor]PPK64288.1 hypothetical protein CLV40_1209 [Actinokineospora auranticolor]